MNKETFAETILSLPISRAAKIQAAGMVEEAAPMLIRQLAENGLQISCGSSSPSNRRTYSRIYLEPVDNVSHNRREKACKVVGVWERATTSGGYFTPLSAKAIADLLKWLGATIPPIGEENV